MKRAEWMQQEGEGDAGNPDAGAWHARLALDFTRDQQVTRLCGRSHFGPLRVQKPLYPEDPSVCHVVILHPPGGVVGGDQLHIRAHAADAAHAFLTTPGAGKWYRGNGRISRQEVRIEAGGGAVVEWMPQETIFYDQADVRLEHSVTLAPGAAYIGCETLCFGRTASGESFQAGRIAQRTSIRSGGKLLWFEQGRLDGGSAAMQSPLALAGATVCATLIAIGPAMPGGLADRLREEAQALLEVREETGAGRKAARFGVTRMKTLMVARYLGHSGETARLLMHRLWHTLRPEVTGQPAHMPRIWRT